jgi:predicted esterase
MLNAWFDVKSNESITDEEDEEGIKRSRDAIVKVIEQEIASGILPSRIFLGGFSQGGAMALYTGLTSPYKLGGILALSTWLPLAKTFPAAAANNLDVPIFQVIINLLNVVLLLFKLLVLYLYKQNKFSSFLGAAGK